MFENVFMICIQVFGVCQLGAVTFIYNPAEGSFEHLGLDDLEREPSSFDLVDAGEVICDFLNSGQAMPYAGTVICNNVKVPYLISMPNLMRWEENNA